MIQSPKNKGVVDASSLVSASSGNRRKTDNTSHLWKCEYCQAEFKSEVVWFKHKCTQMERAQMIKTMDGQAAYSYYCDWFRTLKRKAPPIETFIHSRNYNAFLKLVDFFRKISLASPASYIKYMVSVDISPVLWARDQSYALYIAHCDSDQVPTDAVSVTIEFLKKQANLVEISISEFIGAMSLEDIAVLSQRRLISPYFLIFSSDFRQILSNASNEERNIFVKRVPLGHFAKKLADDELLTSKIRTLVKIENL